MKIDPKISVIIGVFIMIEQAIGGGTVLLTDAIPAIYIPAVKSWCLILAFVGTCVLTGLHAISSSIPGPLAPPQTVPEALTALDVAKKAVVLLAVGLTVLMMIGLNAHAQTPRPRPEPSVSTATTPTTLTVYTAGKPQFLRIPNPLGLPDPLCITDHPGPKCPAGVTSGQGVPLSGNPGQDLASIIKTGGITFVRDMMRADQYLSQPAVAGCVSTTASPCAKIDALSSSCLEGVIPIAKLIVNGPTAPAGPAADATAVVTTDDPAVGPNDEGVITGAAKLDIMLIAISGDALKAACGGWIVAKVQQGVSFEAAVVQFVTTLGITAIPLAL